MNTLDDLFEGVTECIREAPPTMDDWSSPRKFHSVASKRFHYSLAALAGKQRHNTELIDEAQLQSRTYCVLNR